ncbi:chromosome-associated kinesin KIF4A, partial [Cephus cinctus]
MAHECVQVAVRIRPLVQSEINTGCQVCLDVVPGEPQVQLRGTEKSFTYNHVFGADIEQEDFYNTAVKGMVDNIFKGYNVTILAYGQTGSGKTHSMGTCYNGGPNMGVIPRAIQDIFKISEAKQEYDIKVSISFLELYQEQLYDLLMDKPRSQCIVDIREDSVKGITVSGLTEIE